MYKTAEQITGEVLKRGSIVRLEDPRTGEHVYVQKPEGIKNSLSAAVPAAILGGGALGALGSSLLAKKMKVPSRVGPILGGMALGGILGMVGGAKIDNILAARDPKRQRAVKWYRDAEAAIGMMPRADVISANVPSGALQLSVHKEACDIGNAMKKTAEQIAEEAIEKCAVSPGLAARALSGAMKGAKGVAAGIGRPTAQGAELVAKARMVGSPRTMARAAKSVNLPGATAGKQEILKNDLVQQLKYFNR